MDSSCVLFAMLWPVDRRRAALKSSGTFTWLEVKSQSTESCPRWLVSEIKRETSASDDGLLGGA